MSPRPRHALLALSLVLLFALPALGSHDLRGPIAPAGTAVNAVLGDVSFLAAFGRLPTAADDEDLRLRTHLEFVERLLRARDVSDWPPQRQSARAAILDTLHRYHVAGAFPRNRDLAGRRPCFVDLATGNVCAVGYLMEQTVGRDVVDAVNADYQYASILQIDAPLLDTWLTTHGLTRLEAAMIQPAYSGIGEASVQGGSGHILVVPDGSGPTLASEGHVVWFRVVDRGGSPIEGYPFQDLMLARLDGTTQVIPCPGGAVADANTDANGESTFSGALAAGGWTDETLYIHAAGVPAVDLPPLQLTVNSPDLDGNHMVNLQDIGAFALDFASGYAFRSDIGGDLDGTLNLADVGVLAIHNGKSCP